MGSRAGVAGRRQFLGGMAALGASRLFSRHDAEAQMSSPAQHRIDVHHHHTPPPYLAAISARNIPVPSATGRRRSRSPIWTKQAC